ncbi:Rep [uncultured virus]|uniref:Rep n=1 Tax=uncultured virus TaxID=340016 RepID=A0A2K9LST3_9VIRU|nr:Rep [uncultured virus]
MAYKRKSYGRRKFTPKSKIYRLQKQVRAIQRVTKPEYKYKDTFLNQNFDNTGTMVLLNGAGLGDGATEREGRNILVKSIQSKLSVKMDPDAVSTICRLIFFYDRQVNAVAPAVGDLLDLTTTGAANGIVALRNLNNRARFDIILDRRFVIANGNEPQYFFNKYMKQMKKAVYNAGVAGTVADINTNALYMCMICDETTETPLIYGTIRIRFIDN